MRKWLILSALTAFVAASSAFAQDSTKTTATESSDDEEKDFIELHLLGGFAVPAADLARFSDSLGAKNGISFGAEGGYFLTSDWVIGLHFTYSQFDVHRAGDFGSLKHRLFTPALYVRHTFSTSGNFEPFAKALIGVENPRLVTFTENVSGDRYREISYSPSLMLGISAGVTYYTADYSGPFFEVGYRTALSKDSDKNYAGNVYKVGGSLGVIDINIGFRILFGSGE